MKQIDSNGVELTISSTLMNDKQWQCVGRARMHSRGTAHNLPADSIHEAIHTFKDSDRRENTYFRSPIHIQDNFVGDDLYRRLEEPEFIHRKD